MNIAVAGTGYVGLSLAVLLSHQHNHVTAVDVVPEKVDLINRGLSPIADAEIEDYLANHELDLTATLDGAGAYRQAELVVIATPTNYDSDRNFFDTSFVEQMVKPTSDVKKFCGSEAAHDSNAFKKAHDAILSNRWSEDLADVEEKVFARDLFKRDY